VITIFILLYFFVGAKLQQSQKTDVAKSQIVVVKKKSVFVAVSLSQWSIL